MFDPLLELRRRRMQPGLPQVTGNVQPPDVMMAAPPVMPEPMQMQAAMQTSDPNFGGLAELGARRGMNLLMKKMKPEQGVNLKAIESVPMLSRLFRR